MEIPIQFADRTAGQSKMSRAIVFEAVWKVPRAAVGGVDGTAMTELDETTFDAAIAGGPLLVDFWAPWCRPCKALEPILAELPVEVARVNIDEEPGLASRFDVLSIPTVILFAGGEALGTVVGVRPREYFEHVASGSAPSRRVSTARRERGSTPEPSSTRPITVKPSGSGVAASSS